MAARGLNLNNFAESFTENASRLGARIQESISEHTRDLALTRGSGFGYFDALDDKIKTVRKHLDSNSDREKLDGLKTLIALISRGRNVSEFFPYVVKNVASHNLEIRKLVYIYLLRYAESEPDLALLSINTFQKDLTDSNPLIRAMALRVLSGINVPMIGNIVVMAVKKCSGDPSPYVRKAAALALIKCYQMDTAHLPSLIPILETLLKDKSSLSIGAVADAFQEICPTRLDLLHKHYRRLCRMLADVDAWGQASLLELLARYARSMLSKPASSQASDAMDPDLQLLLTSAELLFMSRNPAVVLAVTRTFYYLAPASQQHKFVNPLLRLLHMPAEVERVVLSYLSVVVQNSPELFQPHYTSFLIKAIDSPPIKRDKLRILLMLLSPENFQILLREFVVYADDSNEELAAESVKAIGTCARKIPDAAPHCLTALLEFIKHGSDVAISSSVLVLKTLVQSQLQPNNAGSSKVPMQIVGDLAGRIDEVKHPAARACIVWLVGQYAAVHDEKSAQQGFPGIALWAPDVLRRMAKTFASEKSIVKHQVCSLAAKLLVLCADSESNSISQTLVLLAQYVFSLARYDRDYDVRDRARMLGILLQGVSPDLRSALVHTNGSENGFHDDGVAERGGVVLRREQVRVVLFEGKASASEERVDGGEFGILGSLETVTGRSMGLGASRRLPDWSDGGTDASLRDAEEEYPTIAVTGMGGRNVGFGSSNVGSSPSIRATPARTESPAATVYNKDSDTGAKGGWTDLDRFYEDESEDEDEDESEDEDEDEDEGEEEGEGVEKGVRADEKVHSASATPHGDEESEEESDDDDDSSSDSE